MNKNTNYIILYYFIFSLFLVNNKSFFYILLNKSIYLYFSCYQKNYKKIL